MSESEVADLALRSVFETHFEEISTGRDLTDETFTIVSNQASPSDLREGAQQAQDAILGVKK